MYALVANLREMNVGDYMELWRGEMGPFFVNDECAAHTHCAMRAAQYINGDVFDHSYYYC